MHRGGRGRARSAPGSRSAAGKVRHASRPSAGTKIPALASTTPRSLPGALGDSAAWVGVNPSRASGLPGLAEKSPRSSEESPWHLLRWLEVGCLREHQQPVPTSLLSRRRLLAALSLAVQTPICQHKKSLSAAAVIHIRDQELPVMSSVAEQPVGIKHLIQGKVSPLFFHIKQNGVLRHP